MKILCLVDWPLKDGERWFWKYLPNNNDQIDFISVTGAVDRFPKWGKLLVYYPAYWLMAFKAIRQVRRERYDVVVAWEGKNGFPFALLRSLINQKSPPLIILTFIYRGLIRHFRPVARFGLRSVATISVTTPFEVEYYGRELKIEAHRIERLPFPWYDNQWAKAIAGKPVQPPFILASGRSYRDYATLAEAVDGLDLNVRIIARKFNLEGVNLPANVEIFDFLPLVEYQKLLYQALFVVIPLQDLPHSAGDSHIIQSMSAGKAIVASSGPSPEAYIENNVNGLLVPPGDFQALREKIIFLCNHPNEINRLGEAARRSYEEKYTVERYAVRVHDLVHRVTNGSI